MKPHVPWSVKGIDPEARVVAKEAARKAGMTLGEWMNTMIREVGADDVEEATDPVRHSGVTTDQLRAVVDSLNRLNERLKSTEDTAKRSEERSREAVGAVESTLERLKRVEQQRLAAAAEGGSSAEIEERVEKLEKSDAEKKRIESLKALEQALTQMVGQFESTRAEAIARVEKNEIAVSHLRVRVDEMDDRISLNLEEVNGAIDNITRQLDQTERAAREVLAEAQQAAGSNDEQFVERTGRKLQLLGAEIKRSGDQITAVEQLVVGLSEKIEAAEHRSAEGVAEVAEEIETLRREIASRNVSAVAGGSDWSQAAKEAEDTLASLQRSYDAIVARLEGQSDDVAPPPSTAAAAARSVSAPASLKAPAPAAPADEPVPAPPAPPAAPDSEEAQFDAVFDDRAPASPDADAGAPGPVDPVDPAPAEDTTDMAVTETAAPAAKLTAKEKIRQAAEARAERLSREREDQDAALIEDGPPGYVPGEPGPAPTPAQRRFGLPLVGLLAVIGASALGVGAYYLTSDADNAMFGTAGTPPVAATEQGARAPSTTAENGRALYQQGVTQLENALTETERTAAFETMRRSALMGFEPARYRLAEMYYTGTGTDQDVEEAERWFTEAALAGNAASMHRLGTLATDPTVGGQNFDEALQWFEQAANLGVIDSMYNLGYLYDPTSTLLPEDQRDAARAYFWYGLAARQGDDLAARDAETVAESLTAPQIQETEIAIANWRADPLDPEANEGVDILN